MAGGKDMSLPVFIPLNVVVLFISVYTPYLSLLARLWSHGFKAVEASLRLETFSFGLSLLRGFDCLTAVVSVLLVTVVEDRIF